MSVWSETPPACPLTAVLCVCVLAHRRALSLDGMAQSAALLKNANSTSPLNRSTVGTVAVIGPAQALSRETAGYYGPQHTCDFPKFPGVSAKGMAAVCSLPAFVPGLCSRSRSGGRRFPGGRGDGGRWQDQDSDCHRGALRCSTPHPRSSQSPRYHCMSPDHSGRMTAPPRADELVRLRRSI